MRRLAIAAVAMAAWIVSTTLPALAQSRVALVIGNSAYQSAAPLRTTVADATLVATTLQQAGYDVIGVSDLNKANIGDVLGQFRDKLAAAGPDAVAFIYFAGYGAQYNADDYLVPVDAQISSPASLTTEALPLSAIVSALQGVPSAARIIVLDACRDAGFGKAAGAPLPPGLALMGVPPGFLLASSAAPNATGPDGAGANSPFAAALATLMRQPGLDIEQILKGARVQVNQASNGTQTPWMTSALNVEVKFFAAPAPQASAAANQQQTPQVLAPALGVANVPVPAKTKRRITKARMRDMPADEAYRTAIEDDSLQDYQWFVETHSQYSLAGQIWSIIDSRREAVLWHRTLAIGSTRAYWNYLKRYPDGTHAFAARDWLAATGQPLPPSGYVAAPDDLPPGYYDEAVGLPDIVPEGYAAPAEVFGPLAPIFAPAPQPWQPRQVIFNVQPLPQPSPNLTPANNPITPIDNNANPGTNNQGIPNGNLPPNNPANTNANTAPNNNANTAPNIQANTSGNTAPNNQANLNPQPPLNAQAVPAIIFPPPTADQTARVNAVVKQLQEQELQKQNPVRRDATPAELNQILDSLNEPNKPQIKSGQPPANSTDPKTMTDQQLITKAAEEIKTWKEQQKQKTAALAKQFDLHPQTKQPGSKSTGATTESALSADKGGELDSVDTGGDSPRSRRSIKIPPAQPQLGSRPPAPQLQPKRLGNIAPAQHEPQHLAIPPAGPAQLGSRPPAQQQQPKQLGNVAPAQHEPQHLAVPPAGPPTQLGSHPPAPQQEPKQLGNVAPVQHEPRHIAIPPAQSPAQLGSRPPTTQQLKQLGNVAPAQHEPNRLSIPGSNANAKPLQPLNSRQENQQREMRERENQQRATQERENQQHGMQEHQNQQRATEERQNQQHTMQERQNQQRERQNQQRGMQERENQQPAMQERQSQQRGMQERQNQQRSMQERQNQQRSMQERQNQPRAMSERQNQQRAMPPQQMQQRAEPRQMQQRAEPRQMQQREVQ